MRPVTLQFKCYKLLLRCEEKINEKLETVVSQSGRTGSGLWGFQIGGHYAANSIEGGGNADSYMGGVAFSGLFGEGNEFGVYGGISPAVGRDPLLVEAYYQISVNEPFTFTPAVVYADNDSGVGDDNNFYAVVRATFAF